jgi:hypothetical protein
MPLHLYNSTAAFSPPPVLYEPAARLGRGSPTDDLPALRPRRFRIPREGGADETETIGGGDPIAEYAEKQIARVAARKRVAIETERRLRELLIDAFGACEPFSEASLDDLRAFMSEVALSIRPSIFLLDNGNLRAVWRNAAKEQVALQFLGDKVVQYVMFARRENPPMMMRDAGQDTLAHIRDKIAANGCNHLLV